MQIDKLIETYEKIALEDVKPVFARHETFHPRYGWLKKGFEKVKDYPDLFLREDAPVILGVGKNMVRAIRYWLVAFKLIEEQSQNNRQTVFQSTEFAECLLDSEGWDPFLSNQASLWLLHWHLFKMPCNATAWYLIFNDFHKSEFSSNELVDSLKESISAKFPNTKISDNSLKKDINCIIRMYGEKEFHSDKDLDSLDSPFTELALIKNTSDGKDHYFSMGDKPGLIPELVSSCCLDYSLYISPNAKTISITQLLYGQGSPGLVFKLTESQICESIEYISKKYKTIKLNESAGITQLSFDNNPRQLSYDILNEYYRN